MREPRLAGRLVWAATAWVIFSAPSMANAASGTHKFDVPSESLGDALRRFGQAARQQIVFSEDAVRGKRSRPLAGEFTVEQGLRRLLAGSGLTAKRTVSGIIYIQRIEANGPPSPLYQTQQLAYVMVTGSRIDQPAGITTAAPMTVIQGSELNMRGFSQVGQMLNLVTSNSPEVPVSPYEGYPAGSGQTNPDLFGIGDSRTLTLIDGVRMVTSETGLGPGTVDVNVIPTGLVQRIEIDEGGGAAVYGSDAIAGVVNYILKQHIQGLTLDATGGISSRDDYRTPGFRFTFGEDFAGGRGNAAVDFEWSKTDPLLETERPAFDDDYEAIANPVPGGLPAEVYVPNVRNWTWNSNGVIFSSYNPGAPSLPSASELLQVDGGPAQFSPEGTEIISYDTGIIQSPTGWAIGGQGFPNTELSTLLAGVERYTGAVIGHFDLTDHVTISSQFLSGREVGADPLGTEVFLNFEGGTGASGPIPFYKNNAYLTPSEVAELEQADPAFAAGQPLYLSKYSDWLPGGRNDANTTDTWREMLKIAGDFRAFNRHFNWSVLDAYGQTASVMAVGDEDVSNFDDAVDAVYSSSGQIVCAVNAVTVTAPGCKPIDIFGSIPGTLQPQAEAYVSTVSGDRYLNKMNDFLATLGGNMVELPAGAASFSLAYEHRSEEAWLRPFESDLLGIGTSGMSYPNSGGYYTNEGSTELLVPVIGKNFSVPLVRQVVLNGSFREVDNSLSDRDHVWGSGLRWSVGYGITLRGTKSSNFSQPAIGELIQPPSVLDLPAADPCDYVNINAGPDPAVRRANCEALFAAHPGYGALSTFYDPSETTGTVAVTSQGNPYLVPEVSSTVTFGIVFQPPFIPRLSLTADHIQIKLHDALEDFGLQDFLDACYDTSPQPAAICDVFTRSSQGYLTTGISEYLNAGSLNYVGDVFKADYLVPLDRVIPGHEWGTVDFSAEATHNALLEESVTGFDHTWYQGTTTEPAWVARFDLHYGVGHLRFLYSLYFLPSSLFTPGTSTTATQEPIYVKPQYIQSLSMEYDYRQLTFRAGVRDFTDELPSFPSRSYGDIVGEQFFLGVNARLF